MNEPIQTSAEPPPVWTWEGNERAQFLAFRALPIEEKLKAVEEMGDVLGLLQASRPHTAKTA